jgi:hypothetical protein
MAARARGLTEQAWVRATGGAPGVGPSPTVGSSPTGNPGPAVTVTVTVTVVSSLRTAPVTPGTQPADSEIAARYAPGRADSESSEGGAQVMTVAKR